MKLRQNTNVSVPEAFWWDHPCLLVLLIGFVGYLTNRLDSAQCELSPDLKYDGARNCQWCSVEAPRNHCIVCHSAWCSHQFGLQSVVATEINLSTYPNCNIQHVNHDKIADWKWLKITGIAAGQKNSTQITHDINKHISISNQLLYLSQNFNGAHETSLPPNTY